MKDDVRKIILGTLAGFLVLVTVWVGFLFIVGCGGSLECSKADPTPVRTPIPTLIPASMPTKDLVTEFSRWGVCGPAPLK